MRFNFPLKNNLYLLSIFYILIIFLKSHLGIIPFVLFSIYWLVKLKEKSILIIIILYLPYCYHQNKSIKNYEGKINSYHQNYFFIDNAIVYSKDLIIDSVIKVKGEPQKIEPINSFYTFDFNKYLINKGIYFQINNPQIIVLKEGNSILSHIQKRINSINHSKDYLYKILLGLSSENDVLANSGFCFIGFIKVLELFFNKLFYRKKTRFIKTGVLILFSLIYNFRINLLRLLLYNFLSYFKINNNDKVGIFILIYLTFFPYEIYNIGFWIIAIYYSKNILMIDNLYTLFLISIVQSLFMNYINIIQSILYKYLVYLYGILYALALIILITGLNVTYLLDRINLFFQCINYFKIYGNILGIGFTATFLFKKRYKFFCLIFLMYFSLIHPLSEITFINVGQGDSILIRLPFNTGNYLIDTGKPSSYKFLKNYLDAKGIRKIDYLFISHYDSDHSGNIESLLKDYKIVNLVDTHFKEIKDKIIIYDLNEDKYNNKNDNSLVNLIKVNNLDILFMGDASKKVENDILSSININNIDILKAGHHGSNTSSSKKFIKAINPKLTIFSAGKNNSYNHPSIDIINLFENEGLPYLITSSSGDITITIFYNLSFFYTSDGKLGII